MSLTDEQCAEIQIRVHREFPPPRVVVDHDSVSGEPRWVDGPLVASLYLHPEDYLSLQRWGDRQLRPVE